MKNERSEIGNEGAGGPPSGSGDNYRSRVSKRPSVPWRHEIIRLIRGTLVIIYLSVAALVGPVGDRVNVLGLYRPRLMRPARG